MEQEMRTQFGPVTETTGHPGQDNPWAGIIVTYVEWRSLWLWEVFFFQNEEYVTLINDNGIISETREVEIPL
jgi:hypothetical protein